VDLKLEAPRNAFVTDAASKPSQICCQLQMN